MLWIRTGQHHASDPSPHSDRCGEHRPGCLRKTETIKQRSGPGRSEQGRCETAETAAEDGGKPQCVTTNRNAEDSGGQRHKADTTMAASAYVSGAAVVPVTLLVLMGMADMRITAGTVRTTTAMYRHHPMRVLRRSGRSRNGGLQSLQWGHPERKEQKEGQHFFCTSSHGEWMIPVLILFSTQPPRQQGAGKKLHQDRFAVRSRKTETIRVFITRGTRARRFPGSVRSAGYSSPKGDAPARRACGSGRAPPELRRCKTRRPPWPQAPDAGSPGAPTSSRQQASYRSRDTRLHMDTNIIFIQRFLRGLRALRGENLV